MLTQEEKDILLDIITRLCKDETNYFNSEFADGGKIYIDGCIEYLTDREKDIIKKWMALSDIFDFEQKEGE